jgi:hypothetical protein
MLCLLPAAEPAPKTTKATDPKAKNEPGPRPRSNKPGLEIRRCKVRLSWWAPPEQLPELALIMNRGPIPVFPESGTISNVIDYDGEPGAVLAYHGPTGEKDKKGTPLFDWIPLTTIQIDAKDTDLAIILFVSPRGISVRKFDFSQESFPFGSLQVANFTNTKVLARLNKAVFSVQPGSVAACPKTTTERSVTHFNVAAVDPEIGEHMIDSSTVIMYPSFRVLYFVYEMPGKEAGERYHTKSLMDAMPVEVPKTNAESHAPDGAMKNGAGRSPNPNEGKAATNPAIK